MFQSCGLYIATVSTPLQMFCLEAEHSFGFGRQAVMETSPVWNATNRIMSD